MFYFNFNKTNQFYKVYNIEIFDFQTGCSEKFIFLNKFKSYNSVWSITQLYISCNAYKLLTYEVFCHFHTIFLNKGRSDSNDMDASYSPGTSTSAPCRNSASCFIIIFKQAVGMFFSLKPFISCVSCHKKNHFEKCPNKTERLASDS